MSCHASACPAEGPVLLAFCHRNLSGCRDKASALSAPPASGVLSAGREHLDQGSQRPVSTGASLALGSSQLTRAGSWKSWGAVHGLLIAPPTKGCQPSTGADPVQILGVCKVRPSPDQSSTMCAQSLTGSPKPGYQQALSQTKVTQYLKSDLSRPSELVVGTMPSSSLEKETREIGEG